MKTSQSTEMKAEAKNSSEKTSKKKKGKGKKSSKKKGPEDKDVDSLGPINFYPDPKSNSVSRTKFLVEIRESHSVTVSWPLRVSDESGIFRIPNFQLCDTLWSVVISRRSTEDEDFLALSLVNMSSDEVTVRYSFILIHPQGRGNYEWVDPDEFVTFSPNSGQNNAWGDDEFIEIIDLESFLSNGSFTLKIEVVKQSSSYQAADQALADEIEKISTENDLIKLANSDIIPLIKKLPQTRDLKEQAKQEDRIIRSFKR